MPNKRTIGGANNEIVGRDCDPAVPIYDVGLNRDLLSKCSITDFYNYPAFSPHFPC